MDTSHAAASLHTSLAESNGSIPRVYDLSQVAFNT